MDSVFIEAATPKPIVAILTMDDESRPFRGNHANFIDLIKTGKEMGLLVYVTRVKDLKLDHKKINGYTYHPETKSWSQALLPFPNIIYNRIPFRKDELQPSVQQTIQACLKHPRVRLFNPSFFYKSTLFEWLGKAKSTKKFIPLTKRLTQPQELESVLSQFPVAYLKPVKGKAGAGIMKVECLKTKGSPFVLSVQANRKSRVMTFSDIPKLWSALKRNMSGEEYIVQQGIPLIQYNHRPFDLRVLVQKNQNGEWSLTGIGARVAGKNSITTHVPRGGSIDDPEKLLTASFGTEMARKTMLNVKQASLAIARQIEKASGYILGEMSMDLGIDLSGHIWFFEANSRPMKFDEPDIRKKSLERIIQYSQYLVKNRKKSR